MWKKLREASSGVTLNTVTNLFRNKSYSKFGKTDEHFDNSENTEPEDLVKRKNLEFTIRTELPEDDNVSVDEQSDSDDYGFEQYENRPRRSHFLSSENSDEMDGSNKNRISLQKYHNGTNVPNPKTEVKELVNSYKQRRYQQLEDSNKSDGIHADYEKSENGSEHLVFHKAEDVHQNNAGTSRKHKRSKKIAKRTRRFVRRSWKWIKQGFKGYAMGITIPNLFIVVHTRN